VTFSPGGSPPEPEPAAREASNWAAGERRRPAAGWLAWLLALPSAAILLLPAVLAISSDASAHEIGRAVGRALFPLLVALVLRAAYVRARGRPWRSALSPWLLPIAAVVLVVSSLGRSLPDATERQEEPSQTLSADSFAGWQLGHQ